ncbi:MAG: hypothetical protein V4547_00070 [Bacteroidota bacterium]
MNILLDCMSSNIDWFSSLTLIATLITALATLWTVREVKKQRETSYHPELYLGNQAVFFYGHKWEDKFLPFSYSTEEIKDGDDSSWSNSITIDLYNLGFAVSKAVEYKWDFDINEAIEQIHSTNRAKYFNVNYQKGLEISVPSIKYQQFHMVGNQLRKGNINYILPSSIEKIPAKIIVPSCYIDLYIIFLMNALGYYEEKKDDVQQRNIDLDNFPPLILTLTYKDLHGKTHSKKFKLQFSFSTITSPENLTNDRREYGQQLIVSSEIDITL